MKINNEQAAFLYYVIYSILQIDHGDAYLHIHKEAQELLATNNYPYEDEELAFEENGKPNFNWTQGDNAPPFDWDKFMMVSNTSYKPLIDGSVGCMLQGTVSLQHGLSMMEDPQ